MSIINHFELHLGPIAQGWYVPVTNGRFKLPSTPTHHARVSALMPRLG